MKHPWISASRFAQLAVAQVAIRGWFPATVLFLALVGTATAQEALRNSLAGQAAAEARKKSFDNKNFNARLGPVGMRFSAGLGIEATDNVRLTEDNPEADLIFRPQLNAYSLWQVTDKNALTLGLGIGYAKYLNATDYDQFFLTAAPDTGLSFDVFVGDFAINFHDHFSYSADVSQDPTVSGTGSLPVFQNTVGVGVVWDLNKVIISAGYDHQNYISTGTQFDDQTHTSDLLTASVGFQLQPTVLAGLEAGGGFLDYAQPLSQDNQHISLGPFVSVRLSEYTSYRISAGYVVYFLDTFGLPGAISSENAFYFAGSLNQRVNRLLTHTLSLGKSLQPQFGSQIGTGILDLWQVNYSAAWNILLKTGVNTMLSYQHGNESGLFGETFDWYGAGITFSRTLTQRLTGSLGYQFTLKNSDLPGRDYVQNRLVLNLSYAF